jgi:hypothetical protein
MDDLEAVHERLGAGIRAFILSVIYSDAIRQLTIEDIIIERQGVRRDETATISIPEQLRYRPETPGEAKNYIVAFGWRDGQMPKNDLEILESETRQKLRVIRYEEYLSLTRLALGTLLRLAYRLPEGEQLPAKTASIFDEALQRIARPSTDSAKHSDIEHRIRSLKAPDNIYLNIAAQVIGRLISAAPLIVEIPVDSNGAAIIHYRELLPMKLVVRGRVKALARVAFGAGPTTLDIPLSGHRAAQEYRVWVRVPEGYYFRGQQLLGLDGSAPDGLRWRMRRRDGLPYTFFTMSGGSLAPGYASGNLRLRLSFAEVPPGKSLTASLAAGSCAILIWFIGLALSRTTGAIGTDAGALLLTFPAVAAGWLSFDGPSKRLSEGPMLPQASLLLTLVISLVAAGVFILDQSKFAILNSNALGGLRLLGISKPIWIIIFMLAVLNTGIVTQVCVREALGYLRVLVPPQSDLFREEIRKDDSLPNLSELCKRAWSLTSLSISA